MAKKKAPSRARKAPKAAARKPVKRAKLAAQKGPARSAGKKRPSRKPARKAAAARASRPAPPRGPSERDTIKLAYLLRAPADAIYRALTDAATHAAFIRDEVELEARPGGRYSAFDGFISGTMVELVPDARIVQRWRTKHFPVEHPDSTVEITLTPVAEGTRLDLRHIDVPKEQVDYLVDGWVKYYWGPLSRYLTRSSSPPPRLA